MFKPNSGMEPLAAKMFKIGIATLMLALAVFLLCLPFQVLLHVNLAGIRSAILALGFGSAFTWILAAMVVNSEIPKALNVNRRVQGQQKANETSV